MGALKKTVRELRLQDDLKCRAIAEIAVKQDITYREAEKIMNTEHKKATDRLLKGVLTC